MKNVILIITILVLAGCGGTTVSYIDGDVEDSEWAEDEGTEDTDGDDSDGDLTIEDGDDPDGDVVDGDDPDGDDPDGDTVEDGDDTESEGEAEDWEAWQEMICCPDRWEQTCGEIQGTCSDGQICIAEYCQVPRMDCHYFNAPEDAPERPWDWEEGDPIPDGYGPVSARDIEGTERWLEQCTNELWECDPFENYCCNWVGFWVPEGGTPGYAFDPESDPNSPHFDWVCDADHEPVKVPKEGHCYFDSGKVDEEGEPIMIGAYTGTINPEDPCQHCWPLASQTEWTPLPEGTWCGAGWPLGTNKYCTEDGECCEDGVCE